jgi:hypothetical protein
MLAGSEFAAAGPDADRGGTGAEARGKGFVNNFDALLSFF